MELERRNVDLSGIRVIEMHVRLTLGIMSTGHNISGAGLLTPLGVGTIGPEVTKLAECWCGCNVCRGKSYNYVGWMFNHGHIISLLWCFINWLASVLGCLWWLCVKWYWFVIFYPSFV